MTQQPSILDTKNAKNDGNIFLKFQYIQHILMKTAENCVRARL